MRINTNIAGMYSVQALQRNQASQQKNLERLSSGKRINSAADDAAGAAVASQMTTQIKGMKVASRNASDGISLAQTADGALYSVDSILQRMREISLQSKNGTYSTSDRGNLDAEYQLLLEEITKVATTTSFNGVNLLDGSSPNLTLQIGNESAETMTINLSNVTLASLGLNGSDITDVANSTAALTAIDGALKTVQTARANFGAYQNRLEYTIDNLGTTATNLSAARSRIEDADMAEASSDSARDKVLSQSAIAMLTQANQNPQMIMQLLQQ
ncbi:flagellin [Bacillus cereus]|uniref:Flagellin n=1 Tax=Bacillus cereus TaxID=1396 RepID=A0A164P6B3_BACCE|nr:flagellin [Bacillus cereus]KZD66317.1 Flagellin protein FlaA [Bacillus cereus]